MDFLGNKNVHHHAEMNTLSIFLQEKQLETKEMSGAELKNE